MPDLKGKCDGFAIRVPTPDVSVVDFVALVNKPTTAEEVNKKLDALSRAMNDRLDRIGKKVGASNVIEGDPTDLGAIFASQPELESNLANVDVKEKTAGGIAGALEKARSLRRKEGAK